MKILKYLLFTVIGLLVLALVIAALLPKTFHAEGNATINRPVNDVFNYVKQVKNQENFGTWFKKDKNITKSFSGEDGTVGFVYEWKSKEVGDGKQVITAIIPYERVELDLYFNGSDDAAKSYFSTIPVNERQTNVKWAIDGSIPYPFNIMSLFYDLNNDFEQGISNLKTELEKQ